MLGQVRGLLTDQTYHVLLREDIDSLLKEADYYVHHEYLEDTNEPMYFHDFAELANRHGLRFVADTEPSKMAAVAPPEFREVLETLGDSVEKREQYVDFVKNRRFRRCILCREGVEVSTEPVLDSLSTLRFSSRVVPGPTGSDMFQIVGGTRVSSSDPPLQAVLWALMEAMPRSMTFGDLRAEVRGACRRMTPG